MKKNLIIFAVIAALVVSCFAFVGCKKKAEEPVVGVFTVTVQLASAVDGVTLDKSVDVQLPVVEKVTVYDALQATGWAIVASDSQYGIYVTGIDGTEATDNTGWVYYVNDESGMVAADEAPVAEGDIIKWELISW